MKWVTNELEHFKNKLQYLLLEIFQRAEFYNNEFASFFSPEGRYLDHLHVEVIFSLH